MSIDRIVVRGASCAINALTASIASDWCRTMNASTTSLSAASLACSRPPRPSPHPLPFPPPPRQPRRQPRVVGAIATEDADQLRHLAYDRFPQRVQPADLPLQVTPGQGQPFDP